MSFKAAKSKGTPGADGLYTELFWNESNLDHSKIKNVRECSRTRAQKRSSKHFALKRLIRLQYLIIASNFVREEIIVLL